jgi:hypothetical protein
VVYLLTGPLANFILNDVNKEYTRNIKNGINTPEGPFPPVIYDDNGDVVAIAKLPHPIKNLPDYDLNFLIRFDT